MLAILDVVNEDESMFSIQTKKEFQEFADEILIT